MKRRINIPRGKVCSRSRKLLAPRLPLLYRRLRLATLLLDVDLIVEGHGRR
jgi:hypothetical protein